MRTANLFTSANRKLLIVVDRDFPRFQLIENPQYFAELHLFQNFNLPARSVRRNCVHFSSANRTYSVWSSIFHFTIADSAFHQIGVKERLKTDTVKDFYFIPYPSSLIPFNIWAICLPHHTAPFAGCGHRYAVVGGEIRRLVIFSTCGIKILSFGYSAIFR